MLEELGDRNHTQTVVTGNAHNLEVALQIIISRYQVARLAEDRSLENFIVIGISAQLQRPTDPNE